MMEIRLVASGLDRSGLALPEAGALGVIIPTCLTTSRFHDITGSN